MTMNFDAAAPSRRGRWDGRIIAGLVISLLWLLFGAGYLFSTGEAANYFKDNVGDLGSFLEGVFAPLAFLWLVLGHFLQQGEIMANTRALESQESTTRRIELLSRRDSFFKLQTMIEQQLGTIVFFLYVSIEGSTGNGNYPDERIAEDRQRMDQGDHALFVRQMFFLCAAHRNDPERMRDFFWGSEIRSRHTANFIDTFGKLVRLAREVDEDEMIVHALLEGSTMGRLYEVIGRMRPPNSTD